MNMRNNTHRRRYTNRRVPAGPDRGKQPSIWGKPGMKFPQQQRQKEGTAPRPDNATRDLVKELHDRELRRAMQDAREEQQWLTLDTCIDRLAMHRDAESQALIEIGSLKEALHEKKASEEKRLSNLAETVKDMLVLKESIPGKSFGPVATETWMVALNTHMVEAGASPASTLAAFVAEEARQKAAEKAQFHEISRRLGENEDNTKTHASLLQRKVGTLMLLDVFMGHRLDATALYSRRLEDATQACEARGRVLDRAIKGAIETFWALMAETRSLAEEAAACRTALAKAAEKPPTPANSITQGFYRDWHAGREYAKFVERTERLFGKGSDEVFVATEVVSQQHRDSADGDYTGFWATNTGILGEGSFGDVRRLEIPTLGTSYASKECKAARGDGGDVDSWLAQCAKLTLITEMVVHGNLPSHPNIAQAVAMDDRDTDKLVVLYELANGGDFSTYAWGNESVSMGVLMRLLADMARGLGHLGHHGYSHNDMKPENVLMFKDSGGVLVAKIADLGCALAHGDMREGQGTIGGRAPEGMMRRKVPCDPSQDVYALGHLILLTLSKEEFKRHNMWISEAVLTAEDIRACDHLGSKANRDAFIDKVTLRNQIDPRARATLLNPDHLYDDLGDDVKKMVIKLLVPALSPIPGDRPSMLQIVAAMTTMSERLFDDARPILVQPEAAVEIPRTPCSSAGGIVADSPVASAHAPVTSEVVSCAYGGDGEVQVVTPVLTASPVEPEELTGGGDIAPGVRDVVESGGGGCPAPAPCAPAPNQSRALFPPIQDDNDLVSNGGSGGGSGGGSSLAQVLCTTAAENAGGVAVPMPKAIGAGGGEAISSQALLLKSSTKAVLPCNGGAPARRGGGGGGGETGRGGARAAEWTPRAMAMNKNASTRKTQTCVGGGGGNVGSGGRYFPRRGKVGSVQRKVGSVQRNADMGVGCSVGDGRFVSRGDSSLRRAGAASRTTAVGANAVGGPPRHHRPIPAVAKGGARSFMHGQRPHGNHGAGGKGRHGRGRSRATTGSGISSGSSSGNRGRASTNHGSSSSTRCRHHRQPHPHQQWVKGVGKAAIPTFYRTGPSAQQPQHVHCGEGGTRPAYPSTQAKHSLHSGYNVPMYTGVGGWSIPLAPVPMPVMSWAPCFPYHPVVLPPAFPGYWQRVCVVR